MWVMCSDQKLDSHRFADVIDAAVLAGELDKSAKFSKWATAARKKPAPKDPLKPRATKKKGGGGGGGEGGGGDGDLMALIQSRQAARAGQADDLFASLEAKYGGGGGGGGGGGKKGGMGGAIKVKGGGVSKKK
jgi:DnaJ family protein C protein 9